MEFLLSKAQTYQLEKNILKKNNLDIKTLMNEAGSAVWYQTIRAYGQLPKRIAIFIGSGNNAGDAIIFALHAIDAGVKVDIIEVMPPKSELVKSILKQHPKLKSYYINQPKVNDYDVVIDGMLGIGYVNKSNDIVDQWINQFNQMNAFKVAIDIPSGVDSDSGSAQTHCKVDLTITFFAKKIGHVFSLGKSAQNKVIIALKHYYDQSIGFPVVGLSKLNKRAQHVHKYQCGNVAVIGGSTGMSGAGFLTTLAALRSGVGLARYYYLTDHFINLEPAIMTEQFSKAHLANMVDRHTVLVIGPGLNMNDAQMVMQDCLHKDFVMVLDAGLLHVLPHTFDFNNRCILTPHVGEAAKLLNQSNEYIISHPITSALDLYRQYNTPIILKAASTIIIFNGQVSIVTNGDPSLATAGSGDVLAGMLAGYVARYGLEQHVLEQVVYQHANIGKLWAQRTNANLIASDALKEI